LYDIVYHHILQHTIPTHIQRLLYNVTYESYFIIYWCLYYIIILHHHTLQRTIPTHIQGLLYYVIYFIIYWCCYYRFILYNHTSQHTISTHTHITQRLLDRKNPPPPGGFAIDYVPSSRTVCKRTPLKAPGTNSSRGVLLLTVLDERT